MIFFTSDTHFNHKNVIKYSNRPFNSVLDMNEKLISNWNSVVGKSDTIYHLGDFCFSGTKVMNDIINSLNGNIHLIMGNHDEYMKESSRKLFSSITAKKEIKIGNKFIVMCHYPMKVWNRSHYGSWNLHGHCHGTLAKDVNQIDVGVDCWNYKPVSFEELEKYFSN